MAGIDIYPIARVCHEVNKAYCEAIGDRSQKSWDEAESWQRSSAMAGVRTALRGAGPEALHEAWCAEKTADGWTYGAAKDPDAKTHPCLVPYNELPEHQRVKDHLFRGVINGFIWGVE